MYYDAHMHLNDAQLIEHWQSHIEAFLALGGKWLIIVGTDYASNASAISLVQSINQAYGDQLFCKATVGIHPAEVAYGNITTQEEVNQAIDTLKQQLQENKAHIVALGECGLDAHYPGYETNQWLQAALFNAQIALGEKEQLPLVVHSRDDFNGTLALMRQSPHLKRYLHCWSYTSEELLQLSTDFPHLWIGRCGNTTYPKAQSLRESLIACQQTDIHRLLETDAPYLAPQGKRGEINTSSNIPLLYTYTSDLLNLPLSEVQDIVAKNFIDLYTPIP